MLVTLRLVWAVERAARLELKLSRQENKMIRERVKLMKLISKHRREVANVEGIIKTFKRMELPRGSI